MSAQELPRAEVAARKRTKSFICELPLGVTPAQERVLLVRLEAARQVYNACLGEAKRRVGLVRESKAFQRARALPKDDPARRTLFAQARGAFACSEYGLHAYADQLRQSWLGDHLDSNTCQKLATRAYQAANRLLLGKARRVRGVWSPPAGHRGRQDQHQRHSLARGPGGVVGPAVACSDQET